MLWLMELPKHNVVPSPPLEERVRERRPLVRTGWNFCGRLRELCKHVRLVNSCKFVKFVSLQLNG